MTLLADERAAAAELDYLVGVLQPPAQLGEYTLTGQLARSATAVLYTARGPRFGVNAEGVLKLTGSAYAPLLERELSVLCAAARAGVEGIVRPLTSELQWLLVGSQHADRPVAALALPFLSGGDLAALVARAARVGALGPALALQVARPVAEALRGLLVELDHPVVYGDLQPAHLLLPTPEASPSELTLIDPSVLDGSAESDDVRDFGELLALAATGAVHSGPLRSGNRAFDALVRRCAGDAHTYASMADQRLTHDLALAEQEEARRTASSQPMHNVRAALSTLFRHGRG